MDIRNESEENDRDVRFTTYPVAVLVAAFTIGAFIAGVFISIEIASLLFVGVFVTAGAKSADLLNQEIKQDSYAPLGRVYSIYIGAVILLLILAFPLYQLLGLRLGILLSVVSVVLFVFALRGVAFRGTGELETDIDPLKGPPVIYAVDGEYIDHLEEVASENTEQ